MSPAEVSQLENLSARDDWIGWTHEDRSKRLVHVMDAYVVGALPPYSYLIGGKMVAALMASQEVKRPTSGSTSEPERLLVKKRIVPDSSC